MALVLQGLHPVTEEEGVHLGALALEHDLLAGLPAPDDWAYLFYPRY